MTEHTYRMGPIERVWSTSAEMEKLHKSPDPAAIDNRQDASKVRRTPSLSGKRGFKVIMTWDSTRQCKFSPVNNTLQTYIIATKLCGQDLKLT